MWLNRLLGGYTQGKTTSIMRRCLQPCQVSSATNQTIKANLKIFFSVCYQSVVISGLPVHYAVCVN
jgi:hypothetical protein